MPSVTLNESPLVPGGSPVEIHYREFGTGRPLLVLHGGWGYEVYPFDRQVEDLKDRMSLLVPDRSGYGRSTKPASFTVDFHWRAARETLALMEALGLERPILWGHSDGAVIAAILGIESPRSVGGLILEAFHFYRVKPGSEAFFESMVKNPLQLGERVCAVLAKDHGEDYWQEVIKSNGNAWAAIAESSTRPGQDLYDGRLNELSVPTLFIHGARDPRTEPGELDAVRSQVPAARFHIIEEGKHSPHSEDGAARECSRVAWEFIRELESRA